jgi:hypothetical protein
LRKISQKLAPTATLRVVVGAYWMKFFLVLISLLNKLPDTMPLIITVWLCLQKKVIKTRSQPVPLKKLAYELLGKQALGCYQKKTDCRAVP